MEIIRIFLILKHLVKAFGWSNLKRWKISYNVLLNEKGSQKDDDAHPPWSNRSGCLDRSWSKLTVKYDLQGQTALTLQRTKLSPN